MSRESKELMLRRCNADDLDQIFALQSFVIDGLTDKTLLRNNSRAMFAHCIQDPNITLGLYDGNDLVALAILVDERGSQEDLSKDLVTYHVAVSANLKLIMIKEAYRGRHFQKTLMWILERIAYQRGYTHLCTTVSHENRYSLQNILESGYLYDHSATKYGGLAREVYVKDIHAAVSTYHHQILKQITKDKSRENSSWDKPCDLHHYFQGELAIAGTGDLIAYENSLTKTIHYGLYIYDDRPMIYLPSIDQTQMIPFKQKIDQLQFHAVWINTLVPATVETMVS